MPLVIHAWTTENDDARIDSWRVYVSKDRDAKGELVTEVAGEDRQTVFEVNEGTWYIRVLGKLKDGSEHDWRTAFVATEVIDAKVDAAPDITDTDEARNPTVAEIAPERSVALVIDPGPRDEPASAVQIIQGNDPDTGKLIGEVVVPPRGPTGHDASRQVRIPIPVEGMGRTGDRTYTIRALTRGGLPSASGQSEASPASPEQIHYPILIASVSGSTVVGFPAPTALIDGFTYDPTYGAKTIQIPEVNSIGGAAGDLTIGSIASLPAFVPYFNKIRIVSDVKDLGASVVVQPYVVDIFDDLQRASANGFDSIIDIAGLSCYPFHPASDLNVLEQREAPCWAAREVMSTGKARQPLRNWKWQVYTSSLTFSPSGLAETSWIDHIPGRIYTGRFVAVRFVVEEPVGWWPLCVPNITVRALFQSGLVVHSATPEAAISRPPASICVDEGNAKPFVKITGVGNTGWQELAQQAKHPTRVSKLADTARNTTTVEAADPDLTFAVEANTKYEFEFYIWFDTPALADFKFSLTAPASYTLVRAIRGQNAAGGSPPSVGVHTSFPSAATLLGTGTTGGHYSFKGIFHNGANAGSITFQWAQNTSDAGNTSVLAGSFVEWRKVA